VVHEETQPYDWSGSRAALLPGSPVLQSLDLPEEPQAAAAATPLDAQRLAEIEHDAFAKGFAQGERAGAEAAGTEARALLQRLAETIEELSSTRQNMIRRTERQVVELAMAIAKQLLQREISVDRGLLLAMARVALDALGDQEAATIRLHPDDYAVVNAAPDHEWASGQLTIVADPAVERGGCVVQCDAGSMKVGLDSQFNELARTLMGGNAGDSAERTEVRYGSNPAS